MKKIFVLSALIIFSMIKFSYADSFTVNVPNSQGGYTSIVIQSSGNGYVGPKGEYYSSFPTVFQLQQTYNNGSTNTQQDNPPVQNTAPAQPSTPGIVNPWANMGPSNSGNATPSNVQASANLDMQSGDARERELRAQMAAAAAVQQQRVDQQKQQVSDYIDRNNEMWADKEKAEAEAKRQQALQDAKWTADHKKQTDLAEMVSIVFGWMMLLLGLTGLAFLLLAHIPSKLNDPRSGEGLSTLVAIRQGMTKANFNIQTSKFLAIEILVASVLIALLLHQFVNGFIVFVIAFMGFCVATTRKTAGFIVVYIFSLFWMMTAAGFGFYLCGGNFGTYSQIITAVVGGLVFGVAGMWISMGSHIGAIEFAQDLGSN